MIEGKTINLRLIEEDDLEQVAEWRNKPAINKYFFNIFPISKWGQKDWFAKLLSNERKKLFIIETKEREPTGTIGLDDIDWKNQKAEFGNMLIGDQENQRKGYAKDATLTLLKFAFEEMNLNRIYLNVLDFDKRAIRLYEKCGFQKEGNLRQAFFTQGRFCDIVVMSILRQEFTEKK